MSTSNLSFVPSRTASAFAWLFAGASVLSPAIAQAQSAATVVQQVLPQVVITAADTEQPIGRTIANTTLIAESEIRRSGFVDVPNLLRGIAGVDFTQSGGLGSQSTVMIRGSAGRQVLVLVDGLRVGSATLGTTSLDQLMLDEIDHIEVVRGNVSALYGAAAVGGVIQVFTKQGKGPARPNVSLEVGSHNSQRASAGVRGSAGDTGYALSLSHVRTDGFSVMDPTIYKNANPDKDGYRNTSASANVTHRLNADHQIGVRALLSDGLSDGDSDYSTPTALQQVKSGTRQLSGFWTAKWSPLWTSTLRLGSNLDRSHFLETDSETARFNTRTTQVDLKNEFRLAPTQQLAIGLQSVKQAVDSNTAFDRSSRRTDSLTASYNGDYESVQVQAALRHDRVDTGANATTGLLGLAVPLTDAVRLTSSVATAFNLPTFNDLYYPGYSNSNLTPEKTRSVELGAQYEANGVLARAVWFRTRYTDLIDSPPPDYLPVNVNQARSEGLELTARVTLDDWTARLNYTYQDPKDTATGQVLNRRARQFGSVDLSRDFGPAQAGLQIASVGERRDGTHLLGGYTLVNMTASWKVAPEWTVRGRVGNLTNAVYNTVYGFNTPGREAYLGLVWQP